VASLISYHSGTPLNVSDAGVYNVNYEYSSFGILKPGATLPAYGFTFDQNGIPSIYANTSAVNAFVGSLPGAVGSRGIVRGPGFINSDMALSKYFRLHGETHRLQVRAEAFNATNHVNFGTPALSMASPTTFGEITAYATGAAPRVMQFALRYEF